MALFMIFSHIGNRTEALVCEASLSRPCLEGESCWWQWAELSKLVGTYPPT